MNKMTAPRQLSISTMLVEFNAPGIGQIMQSADAEEIVTALPPELVRFECFAHCGHAVQSEDSDCTEQVLRAFILS